MDGRTCVKARRREWCCFPPATRPRLTSRHADLCRRRRGDPLRAPDRSTVRPPRPHSRRTREALLGESGPSALSRVASGTCLPLTELVTRPCRSLPDLRFSEGLVFLVVGLERRCSTNCRPYSPHGLTVSHLRDPGTSQPAFCMPGQNRVWA